MIDWTILPYVILQKYAPTLEIEKFFDNKKVSLLRKQTNQISNNRANLQPVFVWIAISINYGQSNDFFYWLGFSIDRKNS